MRFNIFWCSNFILEKEEWEIPFNPKLKSELEKFLYYLNLRIKSPHRKWLGRLKLNNLNPEYLFTHNNIKSYQTNYHDNLGQTFNSLNAHTYKAMMTYYGEEKFRENGYFEILYIDFSDIILKDSHYYKIYYRIVYND